MVRPAVYHLFEADRGFLWPGHAAMSPGRRLIVGTRVWATYFDGYDQAFRLKRYRCPVGVPIPRHPATQSRVIRPPNP